MELAKGNVRQAAEKTWGAVALSIKAYAYWRESRRIVTHGDLWEYKDRVAEDLGDWVGSVFRQASGLHTCFYGGWCTRKDVESVLLEARKLIEEIAKRVLT